MPVTAGKLAVGSVGVLFAWSGLSGASVTGSLRDLINGKQPSGANTAPIAGTPASIANAGNGSGTDAGEGNDGPVDAGSIAGDAARYLGSPYLWGGANPPHGTDCSGFVNAVVGRDLHLAIPGYPKGNYSGHGPVTGQWFAWSGCTTVPLANAQPGDLVCWLTHMGIYVGGAKPMISALNLEDGVIQTTIAGGSPIGEPMRIRRLK